MSQVMTAAPAWTIPEFLDARENNHLFIGGADATALVYKFGSPLFVFSESRIRANIARLQAAAKEVDRPITFCYASKANSNMAVLKVVRDAGIDVEVNSGGELYKALRVGFKPNQIIFNGTSKTNHLMTIHRETGHTLEHINLGGGIPVNYLRDRSQADQLPEHEREMLGADLEPSAVLKEALRVARESARDADAEHLLDRVTILLEPGRSIIADAGLVLTTVRNIKRRPETNDVWLLTDAGYNLLLSMNNYKWYYHLISASRAADAPDAEYKVAGPLCDSGDVYFDIERHGRLPDYRLLPREVKPGEVLALLNAGAYSLAQMFPYNGRPLPAAVMIREDGKADLIRRKDTYDDLVANDAWG